MSEDIQFAVVEYTSKSGRIWQHTPSKPNYLADPIKEIDPTSFGCYVSALAGEHVPLKGLIVGPVTSVSKPQQLYRRLFKKLSGSWPGYSVEYLCKFDVLMVVHQLADAHEMVALIQRLRRQTKRPVLIGVPTQPYGLLRQRLEDNARAKQDFISFMKSCDIFISVVKDTIPWYEELAEQGIEYVPQPYPVEFAKQKFKPRPSKEPALLVAGVTQRDNISQGHEVAHELQRRFPEYTIKIPKVASYDYDDSRLQGSRYEIMPFEPWFEHLGTLATTTLVINTDYTKTRGRVQVDCAAVGTPSLGGNSDGTRDLYPKLASTPNTPTSKLIELGTKLLESPEFYKQTVQHASARLQAYNYTASAERLGELVVRYRHKQL